MEELQDLLGCKIAFSKDQKKCWVGQPDIIKKLEKKFGEKVKKGLNYKTGGTPGKGVLRPQTDEEKVDKETHNEYRSGVGLILYLVRKSRPELSNAVRELSKVVDGPTKEAVSEMYRVIKFILDTKNLGLKLEPEIPKDWEFEWTLEMFSDSDWAGDKDNRKSVSGYILFLLGVPITWKSRQQKTVSLSSSKAEWIALSEAVKEILYVVVLISMLLVLLIRIRCNH